MSNSVSEEEHDNRIKGKRITVVLKLNRLSTTSSNVIETVQHLIYSSYWASVDRSYLHFGGVTVEYF